MLLVQGQLKQSLSSKIAGVALAGAQNTLLQAAEGAVAPTWLMML